MKINRKSKIKNRELKARRKAKPAPDEFLPGAQAYGAQLADKMHADAIARGETPNFISIGFSEDGIEMFIGEEPNEYEGPYPDEPMYPTGEGFDLARLE